MGGGVSVSGKSFRKLRSLEVESKTAVQLQMHFALRVHAFGRSAGKRMLKIPYTET